MLKNLFDRIKNNFKGNKIATDENHEKIDEIIKPEDSGIYEDYDDYEDYDEIKGLIDVESGTAICDEDLDLDNINMIGINNQEDLSHKPVKLKNGALFSQLIDVRVNGIYVVFNYESVEIMDEIKLFASEYGLENLDIEKLKKAIIDKEPEFLLTDDPSSICMDEEVDVQIYNNNLSAKIIFSRPIFSGKILSKQEIVKRLKEEGVVYGVNEKEIDRLILNKTYDIWYDIAEGKEVIEGKDGHIENAFKSQSVNKYRPTVREDGSIDYKSIKLFENAIKGQILATRIAPVPGKDGINVYGHILKCKKVKDAPPFKKGYNVYVSSDDTELISEIEGRIVNTPKGISVLPTLEVPGNVDNSVGNIDFIGSVIIHGDVLSGFVIKAKGDVEISGYVEGATIIAGGSVILTKGVHGSEQAKIVAEVDINANFVENSVLYAGRDIMSNSIMHSKVCCSRDLTVTGPKGLFVGGSAVVGGDINVKNLGTVFETFTDIVAGVDYKVLDLYKELLSEFKALNETYTKLEKIVRVLSSKNLDDLSQEKKRLFAQSIKNKHIQQQQIVNLNQKLKTIANDIKSKNSTITVSEGLFRNVRVTINGSSLNIKDELNSVVIRKKDEVITIDKI